MTPALSPLGAGVRRHDPDRFLCALFAPTAELRETLFVLYAFNHEIARAREATSQPMLALIRLQWWREVVEGARRAHEVATPLADALERGALARTDLLAMIEGREAEADEAIPTEAAFRAYVCGTAGAVATAAGRALGADAAMLRRLATLGAAYGVAGQLRAVAALARQGRCLLPLDLLGAHGLTAERVVADPGAPALVPVRAALADWGRALLREAAGPCPRGVIAAALPAVLAQRDLRRAADGRGETARGAADRLAVLLAALRGRI